MDVKPLLVILALSVLLAGCADSTTGSTAPAPQTMPSATATTSPGGASVSISGFKFSPSTVTIPVGGSVTWTNSDGRDHTATDSDSNGFDSGTIHDGASFTQQFTKAGSYGYHCSFHSSMTATVVVA